MKKVIIPAVVVLAALGIWQKDNIREQWETRDMTETEKDQWELQEEGAIREDGKVEVDGEFDKDLNALDKDMDVADSSASDELDELEKEE